MVSIEQTVNAGGGCIWPLSMVETLGKTTKDNNLCLHMDGAAPNQCSSGQEYSECLCCPLQQSSDRPFKRA